MVRQQRRIRYPVRIGIALGIAYAGMVRGPQAHAQRGSAGYVPQLHAGQRALAQKMWTSAATDFRTALEWDPNGVEAHIGLANVFLQTGQAQRAVDEFNAALRLRPHSSEAERGIHLARSAGQEEAAFVALQAQVQQQPNNSDAHATYAEELLERHRLDEALQEAQTALRLNPNEGHAFCALGRIAAARGNDEDARKNLEIAIRHDNTDDDALLTLGNIAMKAKDYKQAISYYRRVVHIVPDETEGHQKLMEALAASGDSQGAAKEQTLLDRLTHAAGTP